MTQKNETLPLVLALVLTVAVIGGGLWWILQRAGIGSKLLSGNGPADRAANGGGAGDSTDPPRAVFADVPNVPQGTFNYGGSTTWAPIRKTVDAEIQAVQPNFRLRYVNPIAAAPGSATGIQMLMQGDLDIAQSSRSLSDQEYQQAEQRGFKLKSVSVAIDAIAVAVHPGLTLPGLTVDQFRDIYTGRITNWQAVGGPNLDIKPLTRPITAGGTVDEIFRGVPFGPTVRQINTTTEALRVLITTPGSIYFASAPEVVPQCQIKPIAIGRTLAELVPPYVGDLVPAGQCPGRRNQLNIAAFQQGSYPLTRNLYVVIKQNGQIQEQAGTAYANLLLSTQGQKAIAQAGYVRIR